MLKKVLLHIDQCERWEMVLKNAQNLMNQYEQRSTPYRIEIVANGEAVAEYALTNLDLQTAMGELMTQNLRFIACNYALEAAGLTLGDIFPFVEVVPAGVVEIADRQLEGYAYIKP